MKLGPSSAACWEAQGAGKTLAEGKDRQIQQPFTQLVCAKHRKSSMEILVSISEGARELETRHQSGEDLYALISSVPSSHSYYLLLLS